MTITDGLRLRPQPGIGGESIPYEPQLTQGTRFNLVEGPVLKSGYVWYRVGDLSVALGGDVREGWIAAADLDGTAWIGPSPEGCLAFEFPAAPVTIDTLGELQEGIVATWVGCRTTPWVAPLPVTVTFRDDGTYSARALVSGGDPALYDPALYYGTDDDSAEKLYALNDLQDSLKGIGQIDIVFWEGNINRGDLRNIELMGNQLQFEFFHQGQYGPLAYQLYRVDSSD